MEMLHYRALLSVAADWHWRTDAQHAVSELSRGALSAAGMITGDMVGMSFWDNAQIIPAFGESWDSLKNIFAQRQLFRDVVVCSINANHTLDCFSISGVPQFDENGRYLGYAGIACNLTSTNQPVSGILRILETDPVTGFANWKTLHDAFNRSLIGARRNAKFLGVLLIRFPELPDILDKQSFSHSYHLLGDICRQIGAVVRQGDVIGRVQTHEFVVLLHDFCQLEDLIRIHNKVKLAFEHPFTTRGGTLLMKSNSVHFQAPRDGESLINIIDLARVQLDSMEAPL